MFFLFERFLFQNCGYYLFFSNLSIVSAEHFLKKTRLFLGISSTSVYIEANKVNIASCNVPRDSHHQFYCPL